MFSVVQLVCTWLRSRRYSSQSDTALYRGKNEIFLIFFCNLFQKKHTNMLLTCVFIRGAFFAICWFLKYCFIWQMCTSLNNIYSRIGLDWCARAGRTGQAEVPLLCWRPFAIHRYIYVCACLEMWINIVHVACVRFRCVLVFVMRVFVQVLCIKTPCFF